MRHIKSIKCNTDSESICVAKFYDGAIIRFPSSKLEDGKFEETGENGDIYVVYDSSNDKDANIMDWTIHAVNDPDNDRQSNIHTHGMVQYDHPDIQLSLYIDPFSGGQILNLIGEMIFNGRKFQDGDYIEDVFQTKAPVYIMNAEETGRGVLRVIIPDDNGYYPWDKGCNPVYKNQLDE